MSDITDSDAPGTPVREVDDGSTGRTIPTSTTPDARTGKPTQEEDPRWWFLGVAGVGVLVLAVVLLIALLN